MISTCNTIIFEIAIDALRHVASSRLAVFLEMLLDLHQALKEPQAAIRAIVAEGSVDGYEQRVCTSFSELFKGASSLEQV